MQKSGRQTPAQFFLQLLLLLLCALEVRDRRDLAEHVRLLRRRLLLRDPQPADQTRRGLGGTHPRGRPLRGMLPLTAHPSRQQASNSSCCCLATRAHLMRFLRTHSFWFSFPSLLSVPVISPLSYPALWRYFIHPVDIFFARTANLITTFFVLAHWSALLRPLTQTCMYYNCIIETHYLKSQAWDRIGIFGEKK